VGRTLGWSLIRSDLYSVKLAGNRAVFSGYGSGHGIGLCQNGAISMAQHGASDREILAFYYPGTAVGLTARGLRWRIYSGERVDLWTTDEKQQRWIAVAEAALRATEARAHFAVASRVRLQLFPSVETYRNGTGESGDVLASTRGAVIRGHSAIDAATLRHEVWHVLIESRAPRTLPDWFREGLALTMSDTDPGSAERTLARGRVRRLIAQYGEKTVLGWVGGLPVPKGAFAK
jgi:stage II sporulation protein D